MCFSGLHEFESQKNHEVNEFRATMRSFCEEKAQERQRLPWYQWMEYSFPCDLEPSSSLPGSGCMTSKSTKKILINVKFEACDVSSLFYMAVLTLTCTRIGLSLVELAYDDLEGEICTFDLRHEY